MNCVTCDQQASYYLSVVYELDDRWADPSTQHSDDYTCKSHIHTYIQDFNVSGSNVIEISVKRLGDS